MGFLDTTIFNSHENSLFNVYMLPQSSNTFSSHFVSFHSILNSNRKEDSFSSYFHYVYFHVSIHTPFIHSP